MPGQSRHLAGWESMAECQEVEPAIPGGCNRRRRRAPLVVVLPNPPHPISRSSSPRPSHRPHQVFHQPRADLITVQRRHCEHRLPPPTGIAAAAVVGFDQRLLQRFARRSHKRPTHRPTAATPTCGSNTPAGDAITHSIPAAGGTIAASSAERCPRRMRSSGPSPPQAGPLGLGRRAAPSTEP